MNGRCEGCGQPCLIDDAWTVRGLCEFCRDRRQEKPAPSRLFEPAPVQLPGQADLFDPDRGDL